MSQVKRGQLQIKQRKGCDVWSKYMRMVQKDKTNTHRSWNGF